MMTSQSLDFDAMRQAMVASQLRTNAVADPRIVAAMARVPRETFVPAELSALAYLDTGVALGNGRRLNPPLATARLLTEARLKREDRVLLIGAARGYAAAVLAELVAHVVAVESDADLARQAAAALAAEGNVTVRHGDLAAGAPDDAPFDVLMIDGAVEEIPAALANQLTPDARVVAGVVDRGVTRLARGARGGDGIGLLPFADLDCAVLPGFARPTGFRF